MEVPSHRACAFCRSQKVRCIMDEENDEMCQRCVKAGRTCVFTPIQKRKQRKRTDTRVAELEREMKMMRSMLKEKQQAISPDEDGGPERPTPKPPAVGLWYKELSEDAPRQEGFDERSTDSVQTAPQGQPRRAGPYLWGGDSKETDKAPTDGRDVIERGMISMATARQLFDSYRRDLFPHYPMVHIPDTVTADEMREAKPTLFLAVLAAAASKESPDVSAMLDKEVLHAYAIKSVVHSEKSLELVQALLLSSIWYHPPNKFGQLKYLEYIHRAVTIALDIGIGTRRSAQRNRFGKRQASGSGADAKSMHPLEDAMNPDLSMTPRSRDSSPDTGSVECRRTFLACFIICAGMSMSLRRPNMLRASSYIRESIEYLERARDAVPSDRTVVAWVKLIIIQDEISTSFAYDDPGGVACITELRAQIMLKDFGHRLTNWWTSTPEVDMTGCLVLTYYTSRLYLHEIALHVDHSPEDFRAPYQMGVIEPWQGDEIPSQVLAEAIAECINCAHSMLNTFLAMSPESSRSLPVFSLVRISFAAFVMAKLCLSAAHPESRIGRVLDRSSLKAESYLEKAIHHVREMTGTVKARIPAIFLALLFKLRAWCLRPEMIEWSEEDAAASKNPIEAAKHASQQKSFSALLDRPPVLLASAIEGPRLTEHSSPTASSPAYGSQQTVPSTSNATQLPLSNVLDGSLTSQSDAHSRYQNTPAMSIQSSLGTAPQASSADNMAVMNLNTAPLTISNHINDLDEQMDLDPDLLNYFGDMNGLAEGGLTGLEDWGAMPPDLPSFHGMFGYQFPPAAGGGL